MTFPVVGLSVPAPPEIVQCASAPENVSFTGSPTPIVNREWSAGSGAYVCDVMVALGEGDGEGAGLGPGPPACGPCVSGCTDDVPGLLTMFANGTGAGAPGDPKPINAVLLTSCAGRTRTW